MVFLVPDHILEKTTCSNCDRYLSVMPIRVYPNGEIKCGRCHEVDDEGASSLYNTVLEDGLFHCINRYNGCQEILLSAKVASHEESCDEQSEEYSCPALCDCDFKGTAYFLLRHVRTFHLEMVLYKKELLVDLTNDLNKIFVYCENFVIFIIYLDYTVNSRNIILNVNCLRDSNPMGIYECTVFNLPNKMKIFNGRTAVDLYSKPLQNKLIIPVGVNSGSVKIKFHLDLAQTILRQTNNILFSDTFKYEIENCANIFKESFKLLSPTYFCGMVPVHLSVDNTTDKNYLSVYLHVDPEDSFQNKPWLCDVEWEVKLLSTKSTQLHYAVTRNYIFHVGTKEDPKPYGYGDPEFKLLYDVLSPTCGFIKDDKITFEVKVRVNSFEYKDGDKD